MRSQQQLGFGYLSVVLLIVFGGITGSLIGSGTTRDIWFALRHPATDAVPRNADRHRDMLNSLTVSVGEKTVPYDRDDWQPNMPESCWSTRIRILVAESRQPVTRTADCRVLTGLWVDPWGGRTMTLAGKVEIDHHIPIHNAHVSGGHAWDAERKADYANDPMVLNAIEKKTNRSKRDHGPEAWQPPLRVTHCRYAQEWVAVKHKYDLTVTRNEKRALKRMLRSCRQPPYVVPANMDD